MLLDGVYDHNKQEIYKWVLILMEALAREDYYEMGLVQTGYLNGWVSKGNWVFKIRGGLFDFYVDKCSFVKITGIYGPKYDGRGIFDPKV